MEAGAENLSRIKLCAEARDACPLDKNFQWWIDRLKYFSVLIYKRLI